MDEEMSSGEIPIPSSSTSFDAYQTALQSSALTATKRAFVLPKDVSFHRTLDKAFAKDLDILSARVFGLTEKLLSYASGTAKGKGKGKEAILRTEEDLLDGYHLSVVDAVDQLYEKADRIIDQMTGRNKPSQVQPAAPGASSSIKPKPSTGPLDASILHAANLPKPQLKFSTPVDNFSTSVPKVKKRTFADSMYDPAVTNLELEERDLRNTHPYLYETLHFVAPSRMFTLPPSPAPRQRSFEDTPFTYISSPSQLPSLLSKLRSSPEIAIDLEYHSLRSYYGFTCLLQISTRDEDFVVDPLAEGMREGLEVLNEVFCDPNIVKVLHGAERDILWLQQDFGLYIVNMFDTYHASRVLGGFPKFGLASLLSYFCGFEADKRYQLADWRIRPLPAEMLHYARSDTHFLLGIYDQLLALLLAHSSSTSSPSPMQQVLTASAMTALQVHTKEMYDEAEGRGIGGWRSFLSKFWGGNDASGGSGNAERERDRRRAVLIAVHSWRDRIAREMDESPLYILPSNIIFRIANAPSVPSDLPALLRLLSSSTYSTSSSTANSNMTSNVTRDPARVQDLLDRILTASLPASLAAARLDEGPHKAGLSRLPVAEYDAAGLERRAIESGVVLLPDLWTGSGPGAGVIATTTTAFAAPTSSLLGSAGLRSAVPSALTSGSTNFATSSSTLFGPTSSSSSHVTSSTSTPPSRLADTVRRIHSTLVLVPSLPKVPSAPSSIKEEARDAQPVPQPKEEDPDVLMMPAEIAYVPASERTTTATEKDPLTGDTIVVVGRSKKDGKRKEKGKKMDRLAALAAAASTSSSETPAPESNASPGAGSALKEEDEDEDELVAFDFASAPNILDDDDLPADAGQRMRGQKRGKKQQKGGEKRAKGDGDGKKSIYGDFGAAPRNRAEPKAGNVSRTFR